MKKESWNNIKERIGLIIQGIFLIVFILSILILVYGVLKSQFGNMSDMEDKVFVISFFVFFFNIILIIGNFDTGARIAAIVMTGMLASFGLIYGF